MKTVEYPLPPQLGAAYPFWKADADRVDARDLARLPYGVNFANRDRELRLSTEEIRASGYRRVYG